MPHMLHRMWCLLCILVLALSLGLASIPDAMAAVSDHHAASMDGCADCPDSHHEDAAENAIPDCHHVMSVALATLPLVADVSDPAFQRTRHALPAPELGPDRSPDHELRPPRA
jgi:hypothetical protein